jgi:phosphatidylserine/phosphatidylglycerophosphate/cardiolipin synthase-like enzyme
VRRARTFLLAVLAVAFLAPLGTPSSAHAAGSVATSPVSAAWTEPQDGYGFLRAAIAGARHSLDLSLYELDDAATEDALVARARAGVDVRVLLDAAYEGRSENAGAALDLAAGGVHVTWAPADQIFHAKYAVVDDRAAYVGTGNLVADDYASTRDFWVEDTRPADVSAIERTFNNDVAHRDAAPRPSGGLVWSPGSTAALVGLIGAARTSLLVENEEMDDGTIEAALEAAAARGVRVRVVMTDSYEWAGAFARLRRAGIEVAALGPSPIYIHAKVICVDCDASGGTVFVGSENFSVSSLVYNRELGVVTRSRAAVEAVERAVNDDFADAGIAS